MLEQSHSSGESHNAAAATSTRPMLQLPVMSPTVMAERMPSLSAASAATSLGKSLKPTLSAASLTTSSALLTNRHQAQATAARGERAAAHREEADPDRLALRAHD